MQEIRDYFNHLAECWDEITCHAPDKLAAVVSLSGIKAGHRVLDIGCGTGVMTPWILAKEPGTLVGLDLAENMIQCAGRRFSDRRLQYVAADLYQYEGGPFDVAMIYSAYPHFTDKDAFFEKVAALLAPGGRMMIAHSQSRQVINGRHDGMRTALSRPLLPVGEEALRAKDFFDIDIIADTGDWYLISGTKR
ncbi:MAG: class I SAM-dependent methyltransferase [Christensenellales bacterium]|jgi:ubiquinone/menaquinone biosynthesis C-methylase UbiE